MSCDGCKANVAVFRFHLQHGGHPDCGGPALSNLRDTAKPNDCGSGNEFKFGVSYPQFFALKQS